MSPNPNIQHINTLYIQHTITHTYNTNKHTSSSYFSLPYKLYIYSLMKALKAPPCSGLHTYAYTHTRIQCVHAHSHTYPIYTCVHMQTYHKTHTYPIYTCVHMHTYCTIRLIHLNVILQVCTENLERDEGIVANFIAHTGEDCKIAGLTFDPRYVST